MEEFIKTLTEQIRCVRARDSVAHEISDHILDQAQAYEESGISHEQALEKAVREMGDPLEIGVALDCIHRPQLDWKMLLMTFLFSILGFFIMCTAGGLTEQYSVTRQCIFMLLGFGVTIGVYFFDYSLIGKYGLVIYIFITAGLFLYCMIAPRVNGRIVSMSMLVYLYAPAYAGILYRFRGKGYAAIIKGIAMLAITSVIAGMLSDSAPATLNLYFICVVMLGIAICKKWFRINRKLAIAVFAGIVFIIPMLIVIYFICFGSGYRSMRLRAFADPAAYKNEAGYIYTVIRENLANAKLIGAGELSGLGGTLSNESIFIPLHLICSYGLLAGYTVILAFAIFLIRAFNITRRQKNQLGLMVSAACSLILFVNCCEGLFINAGMYPATSLYLPFLSYGASPTLTYAVLIGLLLSVHRNEKIVTDAALKNQPEWHFSIKLERR